MATLYNPSGGAYIDRDGNVNQPVSGIITLADKYVADALVAGLIPVIWRGKHYRVSAPPAPELIAIKAAAVAANGAITVAGQPKYGCKLQIRQVIATAITAGTLTLVGTDVDGRAITEVISLVEAATITKVTANAFAHVTSGTVAGLAGGGDGTLGIGQGSPIALPTEPVDPVIPGSLTVVKANVDAADEAVGTVDTTAHTIDPTTAPNGTRNFDFWYKYRVASL